MDASNDDNQGNSVVPDKTSLKRKDGFYELPKIEEVIKCSECGVGGVTFNRTIYKLPDGEDILILLIECPHCHATQRDIIPLKAPFKPGIFELKVDDGDLTHKIMRSSSGKLSIPEIDIESERGPSAKFIITNLEGILLQMKNAARILLSSEEEAQREAAKKTIEELDLALQGKMKFTVILEDSKGGSYIVPSDQSKLTFIEKEWEDSN